MSEVRSAEYEMRCHYEVFELPRECSEEDIKKQYKKLALRYHPDKNIGNEDEATQRFKEISTAYSVLSDPKERRWYDEHREQILRGCAPGSGNSTEDAGEAVDLWRYFSSSCYSGPEDSKTGFYSVYSAVFKEIYEAEMEAGASMEFLPFGSSAAPHNEAISYTIYVMI
jgi:DnaJ homolog subfamily A member 5